MEIGAAMDAMKRRVAAAWRRQFSPAGNCEDGGAFIARPHRGGAGM